MTRHIMAMDAAADREKQNGTALAAVLGPLAAVCGEAGRREVLGRSRALGELVGELGLDAGIVQAAALYPALDAGVLDLDGIARQFSTETAELCRGLGLLADMSPQVEQRRDGERPPEQAEGLRRMLLAAVQDVRLVVVRLADVLLSLREAKSAPPEEQRRLAARCRDIYAPLANRLGIWQLKWELEDLSFRFLEPDTYRRIAQQLNQRREEREQIIEEVRVTLKRELAAAGIEAVVSGRPKHIYSIWRKMQRKDTEIDKIFDVLAVRIFVDDVRDCYGALGVVHNLWPYLPQEFDDYIANPKKNLYQSLHTAVMGPAG